MSIHLQWECERCGKLSPPSGKIDPFDCGRAPPPEGWSYVFCPECETSYRKQFLGGSAVPEARCPNADPGG